MKEEYIVPEMKIVAVENIDIIMSSNTTDFVPAQLEMQTETQTEGKSF